MFYEEAGDPILADADWLNQFGMLYEREFAVLTRTAFLIVGDEAVAEELCQEAFIKLIQHRRRVHNPGAFLRKVVTRKALTALKRSKGERQRLLLEMPSAAPAPSEPDGIWPHVMNLPPAMRAVVVLRFYCDLTHEEIATALGCRPATARTRLHRALRRLEEVVK